MQRFIFVILAGLYTAQAWANAASPASAPKPPSKAEPTQPKPKQTAEEALAEELKRKREQAKKDRERALQN